MKTVVALCVVLVLLYHVEGAAPGTHCTSSHTCGSCCRDSNDKVISTDQGNGPFGGFGGFGTLGGTRNGTCSTKKSVKGEICDSSCQCDTGLACYRPMSGVCCPPSTCVDEAYAKHQHEYWSNCFANPNCAIPP
ncbi:uncharacterized protein [Haliotis cracherodii]|uniref:uncharacterized protein n=1 Tax=Haliotis cracherodii TaxID=6455 RepID=UPI0039EA548A